MLHDLRFAIRTLIKRPGFAIVVILTAALGIGANTAIFSVVDAVLLRPLPFHDPDQLVIVRDDLTGRQATNVGLSVDELRDLRERSGIFQQISATWSIDANLTGSSRPERIELLAVSSNYFELLGATPQLGRVFGPAEVTPGFAEGVVISDGMWHKLFGGDKNVLGKRIRADNDEYTVIGVMPPGFRHPGRTLRNDVDMWASCGFSASPFVSPPQRTQRMLPGAIGRLTSGMTLAQAQSRLDALVSKLSSEFPDVYPQAAGWNVRLLPAHATLVGSVRTTLILLAAAVGLVLLIACVNIANLLLARASARQRELAVRLAIGADRSRLIRQLLTESLLLAVLGGIVAISVQTWVMDVLVAMMPADMPRASAIGFNFGVLIFAGVATLATGVLFGLVPAWQASRPDIVVAVKEGAPGAGGSARHHRFRSALVVVEFALCLVLMIGAGLLLRSFGRLVDVKPGFDPEHVLLARIWLPVPNNPAMDPYRAPDKRVQFVKNVLQNVRGLPGVTYAAMTGGNGVPLVGPHNSSGLTIEDQVTEDNNLARAQSSAVSPDYFRVMGTPLVRGRFFAESDDRSAPPVVIIDEAMANRYFPNVDPVGRRLKFGARASAASWITIVGVVGNMKTDGFDQPDVPHVYASLLQNASYALAVYARTESDPARLAQSLTQQVQAVDRDLPVFGQTAMTELVTASLAQRVFALRLVGLFGVLALLLAAIGIYGMMAFAVTQRTREIGIRIALGASRARILRLVILRGLRMSLAGIAIGLASAFALTQWLRGMLFDVAPTDPATYLALSALLAAVAIVASYVPARRATRVNPMVATE